MTIELVEVHCQLCGSQHHHKLHVVDEYFSEYFGRLVLHIRQCRECGFVYTSPRPSENCYNQYYAASGQSSGTTLNMVTEQHPIYDQYEQISRSIINWLNNKPAGEYLEVGCGNGIGLKMVQENCHWHCQGIDPAPVSEFARNNELAVTQQQLNEYANRNKSFDFISCSHVLEHLWDPLKAIKTMKQLLSPSGVLMIVVPNIKEILTPEHEVFDIEHVSHFTHYSLSLLLAKAGFKFLHFPQDIDHIHCCLMASNNPALQKEFICTLSNDSNSLALQIKNYSSTRHLIKATHLEKLNRILTELNDSGKKWAIYGAGNFAFQLFSLMPSSVNQAVTVVDQSLDKQGKCFFGVTIEPPHSLSLYDVDAIFVASKAFAYEIAISAQQYAQKPLEVVTL
jgi:2-polyprenyl-3-methyl-5-hydroxy-6-metoxy-1,4-benzoquinol methylase